MKQIRITKIKYDLGYDFYTEGKLYDLDTSRTKLSDHTRLAVIGHIIDDRGDTMPVAVIDPEFDYEVVYTSYFHGVYEHED